jgi:hypothetical protein
MSAILEGEGCTSDTLMRAEVTTTGIQLEIFDGDKGRVRITLSEEKWILLEKYINDRREKFQELKKSKKTGGN